jgi:hypothetical protein
MIKWTHKHVYVYEFQMQNHESWGGRRTCTMEYALCTNVDGPDHKENRKTLEQMLRLVYKHYPKGVKFVRERR